MTRRTSSAIRCRRASRSSVVLRASAKSSRKPSKFNPGGCSREKLLRLDLPGFSRTEPRLLDSGALMRNAVFIRAARELQEIQFIIAAENCQKETDPVRSERRRAELLQN